MLYASEHSYWLPADERFLDAAGQECPPSSAVQRPTWNQHLTIYPPSLLPVANAWQAPTNYVGTPEVYHCPDDPRPRHEAPWRLWGSYAINTWMSEDDRDPWSSNGHYRISSTYNPGAMFLFADTPEIDRLSGSAMVVHPYFVRWDCTDFVHWPQSNIVHGPYWWHLGRTRRNVAYHDGHVRLLNNQQIPAIQHSSGWGGVPTCDGSPCIGNGHVVDWDGPPWRNAR